MDVILTSPMFGLLLTVAVYNLGVRIQKRWPSPLLNPIVVATAAIIGLLTLFGITYEAYAIGGGMIHFFLGPLTVSLALPLYRHRERIRRNFAALLIGIFAGIAVSAGSITIFARVLGLDESLWLSLLPKSLTNPIAAAVSEVIGGSLPLTVVFVIITGVTGVLVAPFLYDLLHITHPVARGAGLGTASHALGTARAFEYSEVDGGISSVCIGLTGLFTTLLMPLILQVLHF